MQWEGDTCNHAQPKGQETGLSRKNTAETAKRDRAKMSLLGCVIPLCRFTQPAKKTLVAQPHRFGRVGQRAFKVVCLFDVTSSWTTLRRCCAEGGGETISKKKQHMRRRRRRRRAGKLFTQREKGKQRHGRQARQGRFVVGWVSYAGDGEGVRAGGCTPGRNREWGMWEGSGNRKGERESAMLRKISASVGNINFMMLRKMRLACSIKRLRES